MHWLAFHNDYKSVSFILSKIKFEISYDGWLRIIQKTRFRKLTPLDIAGKRKYVKVL